MGCLAVSETTTYRWTLDEDVRRYRELGVTAIGVWRRKLADFGEERGVELIRESGLEVSSLTWAGGFTGSDGRTLKESILDAEDAIRTAAELQAGCVICYSGGRGGHTHNHARRLIKSALKEIAPISEEAGIPLAIEPMHHGCSTDFTFLTGVKDALEISSAINSPALKLVFDTYHLCHDAAAIETIPDLVPQIALVQLGDARGIPDGEQNRCVLGQGRLPLMEVVLALKACGYDGHFELELLGEDTEAVEYEELITMSKDDFDSL